MPLFEFACADCGTRFELLVREGTALACPSCRSARVEKQLSAFAVGAGTSRPAPAAAGPACGSCPHAGQPGGCSFAGN
jgi:putative FmdB family regulatory protein